LIVQHFCKQINENQYWHKNLLLYLNDGSTLMYNTLWLGSQHMDVVMKYYMSQNYNIKDMNFINIYTLWKQNVLKHTSI